MVEKNIMGNAWRTKILGAVLGRYNLLCAEISKQGVYYTFASLSADLHVRRTSVLGARKGRIFVRSSRTVDIECTATSDVSIWPSQVKK